MTNGIVLKKRYERIWNYFRPFSGGTESYPVQTGIVSVLSLAHVLGGPTSVLVEHTREGKYIKEKRTYREFVGKYLRMGFCEARNLVKSICS